MENAIIETNSNNYNLRLIKFMLTKAELIEQKTSGVMPAQQFFSPDDAMVLTELSAREAKLIIKDIISALKNDIIHDDEICPFCIIYEDCIDCPYANTHRYCNDDPSGESSDYEIVINALLTSIANSLASAEIDKLIAILKGE